MMSKKSIANFRTGCVDVSENGRFYTCKNAHNKRRYDVNSKIRIKNPSNHPTQPSHANLDDQACSPSNWARFVKYQTSNRWSI